MPQGINYQGVLRNSSGLAIPNQNVGIKLFIRQGAPNGSSVYDETHTVVTDTFGLYRLTIGQGAQSSVNTFSSINWANGPFFLEVSADPNGGNTYQTVSTSQLLSVPFALYAQTAGSGGGNISGTPGNLPMINSGGNGISQSKLFQDANGNLAINGTTALPGAALDIMSKTSGLLIPRMSLNDRNLIANKHHGLLIYQTNSSLLEPQGFYYFDSIVGSWLMLAPIASVWTTLGTIGTTPGTNFMGTVDNKDVVFKTGSPIFTPGEVMRLLSSGNGSRVQFGDPASGTHYIFPKNNGSPGQILQLGNNAHDLQWVTPTGSTTLTPGSIHQTLRNNGTTFVNDSFLINSSAALGINLPNGLFATNDSGIVNIGVTARKEIVFRQTAANGVSEIFSPGADLQIESSQGIRIKSPINKISDGNVDRFEVNTSGVRIGTITTGYFMPNTSGTAGQFLVTNGAGTASWSSLPSPFPNGNAGQILFNAANGPGSWDTTSIIQIKNPGKFVGINTPAANIFYPLHVSGNSAYGVVYEGTNVNFAGFQANAKSAGARANFVMSHNGVDAFGIESVPGSIFDITDFQNSKKVIHYEGSVVYPRTGIMKNSPKNGIDLGGSLGLNTQTYSAGGVYTISLGDPYTVHLVNASGSFTFNLPDATQCMGRILIFSLTQVPTGGSLILAPQGGQTLNGFLSGSASLNFNMVTGINKTSIGIISDGSNWQIIFRI